MLLEIIFFLLLEKKNLQKVENIFLQVLLVLFKIKILKITSLAYKLSVFIYYLRHASIRTRPMYIAFSHCLKYLAKPHKLPPNVLVKILI